MTTQPTRTIVSRRARPAKDPLSRELIVATALELLQKEGSAGLSMRKIAKALDTGPSSLYVYVANMQELSSYVLDLGLAGIPLPASDAGSWQTRLFDALSAYLLALYDAPGVAELALTTVSVGPHALAFTEYLLQCLHEGGVSSLSAAWGVDLLMLYATSVAFEQSSRDARGTTIQTHLAAMAALDPQQYPRIASSHADLISGSVDGMERFRWGLDVILQGIMKKEG
ncbi:TetR/AcrR family transcriptional regulator [Paenibacillus ferrarius]|uniref:TetR/AcrR family transcriptional regulator n=1 Tax=Paenibacillus ferrarius TaxID=1469647 RepID=UPI003D2B4EA3